MNNPQKTDDGLLLVLTGPFACGKTSIANALQIRHGFEKCLTVTTRPPRPGEHDGIDYFFVSKERFETMRDIEGSFLETTETNGHLYGAPRSQIEKGLAQGKRLVVCLDPKGIYSLSADRNAHIHRSFVSYYINVELLDAVARFISRTPQFSRDDLNRRLQTRIEEEKEKGICDYRIENPYGRFDEVVDRLAISFARKHKEWLTYA